MVLGWLFGDQRRRKSANDRSERNAVIRRIVSAASDSGHKRLAEREAQIAEAQASGRHVRPIISGPSGDPSLRLDPGNIPEEQVAQRAYEIWIRKNRPAGTSDSDWNEAVVELQAEVKGAAPGSITPANSFPALPPQKPR